MIPLYILKLGGSVATQKNRLGSSLRRSLLRKIARAIKRAKERKSFNLILIHGSGAGGHQLARKYGLESGVKKDKKKWYGALLSRVANQKLDILIAEIFISEGLRVTSVHTASAIIQENKKILKCDIAIIQEALRQKCLPLLYGEMAFDAALDMSICSGDAIAPYLARKLNAQKIFFASDIDGIYTKDPYLNKNAKLIEEIFLNKEVKEDFQLSKSHNIDASGGLFGKIGNIKTLHGTDVESVEIFNGFKEAYYEKALLGEEFPHTTIKI